MIQILLFYVLLPIVILIGIIGGLYWLLIGRYPNASLNDPDIYDDIYDDDDDDVYDNDDMVDINYQTRIYKDLDEVHLMAHHLWGEATEYTVEHVRKLLEMENDVYDFMDNQDGKVLEYLSQMKMAA